MLKKFFTLQFILILLSGCLYKTSKNLIILKQKEPQTIFIHGIVLPIITNFMQDADCPLGFYPACSRNRLYFPANIAHIISQNNPEFNWESFYIFGWCGSLCFEKRKEAAQNLYHQLKKCSGPLTIIGYSHGCNVALNLAQIAQEHNDQDFIIDKLILLASPVQQATEEYINCQVFKRIFAFYSSADIVQILDPQGIYKYPENREIKSFFSKRIFASAPNLIQARILFDRQSPNHTSFISKRFLKHLGSLINLLEQKATSENNNHNHYIINLSRYSDKPQFLTKEDLKSGYIPRVPRKKFIQN